MAFTFTDCFVFESTGTWKNFVYENISLVLSVASRHPLGDTVGMMSTPNVNFTEGIDYEVDYTLSRLRLIPNALTNQFVWTKGTTWQVDGNMPRIYVVAKFEGNEYHPSQTTIDTNAAKLPRWYNNLRNNTTINILFFGDSTTYGQVDNEPTRWYNVWAKKLKQGHPNINTVNIGMGAISGTSSMTLVDPVEYDPEYGDPLPPVLRPDAWVCERASTLLGAGVKPDLVIVNFINDANNYDYLTKYYRNVKYLVDSFRITNGWNDVEFAVISGLKSPYTIYNTQLRDVIINLSNDIPNLALIDVSTVWTNLFSRKTNPDILANNINHQNSMSTIAYSYELDGITFPVPAVIADEIISSAIVSVSNVLGLVECNSIYQSNLIDTSTLTGLINSNNIITQQLINNSSSIGVLSSNIISLNTILDISTLYAQIETTDFFIPIVCDSSFTIGILDQNNILINPSITVDPTIGVLDVHSINMGFFADYSLLISTILTGGGSIRSPSGNSIDIRRIDGTPITIKRYIQGM